MVSPKGFSINANISAEKRRWVIELIRFLMNPENQLESAKELFTMPTHMAVQQGEFVQGNEILRNSALQIAHGRPMPVVPGSACDLGCDASRVTRQCSPDRISAEQAAARHAGHGAPAYQGNE